MTNRRYNKKKKGRPKTKTDSTIPELVQEKIITGLGDDFFIAKQNMEIVNEGFDDFYDMVHCKRANTENEWESDVALPEFISRLLAQVGHFAVIAICITSGNDRDFAPVFCIKTTVITHRMICGQFFNSCN